MPKPPFRWTRFRRAIRTLMERGDTEQQVKDRLEMNRRQAAAEQGWRQSELAMAIIHDRMEVEDVARRIGKSDGD